jgi:hypothetical protein
MPFKLVPFLKYLQTYINRPEQRPRDWKIATKDSKMPVLLFVKMDRCIQSSVQAVPLQTNKQGL